MDKLAPGGLLERGAYCKKIKIMRGLLERGANWRGGLIRGITVWEENIKQHKQITTPQIKDGKYQQR